MTDVAGDTLFLTFDDVRRELRDVPPSTLRQWVQNGTVPAPVRIGKHLYWLTADFRAWAEAGAPGRAKWEEMKTAAGFSGNRKQGGKR
jgi:hypothetical protein